MKSMKIPKFTCVAHFNGENRKVVSGRPVRSMAGKLNGF
jgi:hypothetical protein